MNNNSTSRPDGPADFPRLVQELFLQAWRVFGECEQRADRNLEELADNIKQHVNGLFRQLEEHIDSLHVPHDILLSAVAQLNSLQGAAQESLERLEGSLLMPEFLASTMPRLGMFQQKQAHLQALAESLAELRIAQTGYIELLREAANEAAEGFRLQLAQQQEPLAFRELYELWLNSGEEAYERMLESEAYSRALARLANCSAASTAQAQKLLDEALRYFNLPTRDEMTGAYKRLQELRRRQRETERRLPAELDAIRREMAELRAEVAGLRAAASPRPAAKTSSSTRGKRRDHAG